MSRPKDVGMRKLVDPETGEELSFGEAVSALLVCEHKRTKFEADKMVKEHANIVLNGIMFGDYRATAVALEMAEGNKD